MAKINTAFQQLKDLSSSDLHDRLLVTAKNILESKLSQNSVKRHGSALQQRRQIARLLTRLHNMEG